MSSVLALCVAACVAVAGGIVAVAMRPVSPPARTLLAATSAVGRRARPTGQRRSSRRRAPPGELIDLLDAVSRNVRSGSTLRAAVESGLRSRPTALGSVARLLDAGATMQDALAADVDAEGVHDRDEHLVRQALAAAARSGGQIATPIERAAGVLRERQAGREERRTQSAQARLSATVMTLLPPAFALWGVASSPRVRASYVSSTITVPAATVGLFLNALGWWWMRRLVNGTNT